MCAAHGRISRCYATGPLWFNTVRATVTLTQTCPLGCLTGAPHGVHDCSRAGTASIAVGTHAATGTVQGLPALSRLIGRTGGGMLRNCAFVFESTPFTVTVCVKPSASTARTFLLQSAFDGVGIVATVPLDGPVGSTVALQLDPLASPGLCDTYRLLWRTLTCADIG